MSKKKYMWVGYIPSIWGYGATALGESDDEVLKALKKDFYSCRKARAHEGLPDHFSTFSKAFEYFGGRVHRVELGKVYFENFNY